MVRPMPLRMSWGDFGEVRAFGRPGGVGTNAPEVRKQSVGRNRGPTEGAAGTVAGPNDGAPGRRGSNVLGNSVTSNPVPPHHMTSVALTSPRPVGPTLRRNFRRHSSDFGPLVRHSSWRGSPSDLAPRTCPAVPREGGEAGADEASR